MRCSSCEPLLDAYLETTLRGRLGAQVAEHLRSCAECASLLGELRVIDALLTTARAPGSVESDFTESVVSATRVATPHARRRLPFWIPIAAYLAAAWGLLALLSFRSSAMLTFLAGVLAAQERGLAAVAAAARALAPATPLAAAAVTAVLFLDLALLGALYYGYRRVHPLLALYLSRGSRS